MCSAAFASLVAVADLPLDGIQTNRIEVIGPQIRRSPVQMTMLQPRKPSE